MPADIALIVTCHEPYLRFLPETMASIERQHPAPAERVIVFDGCAPPSHLGDGWRCITGNWGHPSGARNAGIGATTAPWLTFLDADNVAPDGYVRAIELAIAAAQPNLAIIYPDIQYVDETLTPRELWRMPPWDYWEMRRQNCVDTSSAWRREAIELTGGWPVGEFHEDYHLALSITAAGWKARRLEGPPIIMREHRHGRRAKLRHSRGGLLTHIWRARSLGIVSLLAGRASTLNGWKEFLLTAELPPRTALYVVDNSGSNAFRRRVHDICTLVAAERNLTHVDIALAGRPYRPGSDEPYMTKLRHLHIAQLYAATLPRVTEDLVLTLEDDVEPPRDAIRRLGEEIGYPARANIGVVAAAYPGPTAPDRVCAGLGPVGWGAPIGWNALPREPLDVACVGGGCAVWANWALRECVPHVQWHMLLGWDGVVCTELARRGYRVRLHGDVRCEHHSHGHNHNGAEPALARLLAPRPAPPRLELPSR